MLYTDEDVQERVSSPLNLLNRLRTAVNKKPSTPCLPAPSISDLIPDINEKVEENLTDVRKQASKILTATLKELEARIPDIQKPEKLAQIAVEMNKVLVTRDDRDKEDKTPRVIVYAPQVINENVFETIHVSEETL